MFFARDIEELLDTIQTNVHELCLMVCEEVPQEDWVLSPQEAVEYLYQAILTGQIKPQNHPKRLTYLVSRLVRGELEFELQP